MIHLTQQHKTVRKHSLRIQRLGTQLHEVLPSLCKEATAVVKTHKHRCTSQTQQKLRNLHVLNSTEKRDLQQVVPAV